MRRLLLVSKRWMPRMPRITVSLYSINLNIKVALQRLMCTGRDEDQFPSSAGCRSAPRRLVSCLVSRVSPWSRVSSLMMTMIELLAHLSIPCVSVTSCRQSTVSSFDAANDDHNSFLQVLILRASTICRAAEKRQCTACDKLD